MLLTPYKVTQKPLRVIFTQMKINIPYSEYELKAVRSGGAGGQHVNKVSSRVELYFNVSQSTVLTEEQKERILLKLGSKLTEDGLLRITDDTSRSQHANREGVIKKLHDILAKALVRPKKRVATKVPKGVKRKRLETKKKKGEIKKLRKKSGLE